MKHVYPLNTAGGWCWLIAFLAVFSCTTAVNAQVSGVVFRDFDSNGIRSDTLPIELGVSGVTVRAFVGFSKTPVSTSSDANGNYSFNSTDVPAGSSVRIEFGNFLTGYFNSSYGGNNGTSVQFAKSPAEHIDMGINYPSDYCQREGKLLITSCFVNGNSQSTLDINGNPVPLGKQAAQTDALVMLPYEASGIAGPGNFPPAHMGTAGEVGTVWGLAYQRRTKKVFSTAFVKRHTSFGPAGPGGIYVTDIASGVSSTFMSVTALGINAGEDPHKDPLANLFGDRTAASTDPSAMSAVGRMSFGGADMSEDDKTLYFVNLNDRKVYGLFLGLPAVVPTSAADMKSWAIPDPGCSNGDFRPWALKVHRGKIYVGVVCSAETSQQASDLKVTIYRFDPAAVNAIFDEVLSFPLDYQRGPLDITGTCITKDHWLPWTDAWPEPCGEGATPKFAMSAQPMLTDLDFDVDGSMFIGMLSRFAHMGGQANHDPNGSGNYDSFGFGDVLRAYNNNGTFELEYNGQAGPLTGTGVGDNDGPGGGEFYGLDNWKFFGNVANREITTGSLSFAPGYNEIINSTIDPIEDRYLSGGFKVFNATKATITREYELYRLAEGLFAKAGGLGDNKLLCDAAPIEIGNRFWFDDNRDGIQNAYEPGIDGVVLTLYDMDNGGTLIASQTTHDGGQFYFNNTTVPAGLQYNHHYEIRTDMTLLSALDITLNGAQPVANGVQRQYKLSPANSSNFADPDLRDSDAQLVGSKAIIAVTTLEPGQNDFTNDLGIYACPELQNEKENLSLCSGMPLDLIASTGTHLSQVDSVRFVVFSSPQSDTAMYGAGGTLLGTVLADPTTGRAVLNNPLLNTTNTTAGSTNQYIYAIIWPMPADPNCRQSSQTVLTISPAMSASAAGGEITCSTTQITLSGQAIYRNGAAASGATYSWTGPNEFSSNEQNPLVSLAGTYTLTVSNSACPGLLATTTATVTTNTTVPAASVNKAVLTCTNPIGTLTASVTGGTAPYTYWWNTNATTQSIDEGSAGTYFVVVTGANGCSTTATATITLDRQPPVISLNPLMLTCAAPSGTLTASLSGGTAPYTYLWSTGGNTPSITVGDAGLYSVVVTGVNGCQATATSNVSQDNNNPTIAINNLMLTCTNPSGQLMATVSGETAPLSYYWNTGATTPGITVSAAGPYSVTVIAASGCTTTATTTVLSDLTPPVASLNSLTLTCANPLGRLTINANGNNAPYAYLWSTGATSQNIVISTDGPYSVTVTSTNGCKAVASTTVGSDRAVPSASVNAAVLTCTNPISTLSASVTGGTAPYAYWWSNNTGTPSISVGSAGSYSVVVTGANGCTTAASATITSETEQAVVVINNLTLTCINQSGTLAATTTGGTAPYTYLWSTGATATSIPITTPGLYSLTVTGANGCVAITNSTVLSDMRVPVASVNSLTLTCANPSGTLTAIASEGTAPYAYLWSTGATTADITTSTSGIYSVTVTGANGCSTKVSVTVMADKGIPGTTVNDLVLTCAAPVGTLVASVTGGSGPYQYAWSTGATTASIPVGTAGPYSVTVIGANGCSAVASTLVSSDTVVPSVSVNDAVLTCSNPLGTLSATVTGGTAPYAYWWSNNISTPSISVGSAGSYSVVVTGANGCTASASASVNTGTEPPLVLINAVRLTCTNLSDVLTATATGGIAPYTYLWSTGATSGSIPVTAPGLYSLTVTGANGCVATTNSTVLSDMKVPVASVNSLTLTCANPTGTLVASVSNGTAPYTYQWSTGATTASVPVGIAGPYSVTVIGANGCSTIAATTITDDTVVPGISVNSLTLTCAAPSGTLTASATGGTAPYSYLWSTGATTASVKASSTGTYSVTVIGANGCSTTATTTVTDDTAIPGVSVNSLTLTCADPSGTLSASATGGTAPYTYLWSTGATTASIFASLTGPYSVTVTGANGCKAVANTTVGSDRAVPSASVNAAVLTCTNPISTLSASVTGGTAPYAYWWSNNTGTPSISVGSAGSYSVVVTGANGCSISAAATVRAGEDQPVLSINTQTLTCINPSGPLSVSATGGTAPYAYLWNTGATTVSIPVNTGGPYSVSVTGANGCLAIASSVVLADLEAPAVSVNSLTLTCTNPLGTLTADLTGGSKSYTYRWSTGATTAEIMVGMAGPYSVTVLGANGCSATASTTVVADGGLPIVSVNSLTLTCANPSGTLTASASGGSRPYGFIWSTGVVSSSITVSTAGPYSVTVIGPNGCRAVASTVVTADIISPTMTTSVTPRTCTGCPATVAATSPGAVLSWTGPNNFAAVGPGAQVTDDGTYVVTATTGNGCTVSARLAVVPFICPPAVCIPIVVRRGKK